MAVIQPGAMIADMRGSVGDVTFLRTQGGLTARTRNTPANPDTAPQQAVRNTLAAVAASWSADLTASQREGWRSYAHAYPRPNRWGSPTLVNGYTRFIRTNVYRYRELSAIAFPNAPTAPPLHLPAFTIRASRTGGLAVAGTGVPDPSGTYVPCPSFNSRPAWRRADSAYFLWYAGAVVKWYVTTTLGVTTANRWGTTSTLVNTYAPFGSATGNPTVALDTTTPAAEITVPPENYTDPENGLRLYAYAGLPTAPGVAYFNGPWTLAAAQTHAADWETNPWRFEYPFAIPPEATCRIRLIAQSLNSGALSGPGFGQAEELLFND